MLEDERERLYWLCKRIVEERDVNTFTILVTELNELLRQKERRLFGRKDGDFEET